VTQSATVTVGEGNVAHDAGSFADYSNAPSTLAESITLSASIGSVSITSGTGSGSWAWSYTAGDEGAPQTVTIFASEDGSTLTGTTSFTLNVTEVTPLVSVTQSATVTVGEGNAAANAGNFADYSNAPSTLAESITLSASIGSVSITSGTGAGTWAWSYTAGDEGAPQTVTIFASENGSTLTGTTSFTLNVTEVTPLVGVTQSATVNVGEGGAAANAGTFADYSNAPSTLAESITLSASIGSVSITSGTGSGTWAWSYTAGDEGAPQTVTIFASEDGTVTGSATFELDVTEVAPLVSVTQSATVTVGEGNAAANAGSFADYSNAPSTLAESITLSASIGSVSITSGTGSGTWAWSYTAGDEGDQTVTIFASENGSTLTGTTTFTLHATEVTPLVSVTQSPDVSVAEGNVATNAGTFADYSNAPSTLAETITLSASIGSVSITSGTGAGTWAWSYTAGDEGAPQTVTIFASEDGTVTGSATFELDVTETTPLVSVTQSATVTVGEGNLAHDAGTFADYSNAPTTLAESITLSASIGSVSITSGTGAGTWAWSYTAGDEGPPQTVTIFASENGSPFTGTTTFTLNVTEVTPLVSVTQSATVTVGEGNGAHDAGTFADYSNAPSTLAESITLSASIGSVSITSGTGSGSWAWSYTAGDEGAPQTVTIFASENGSTLTGTTTFALSVTEVAPLVFVTQSPGTVTVGEGGAASNAGSFADYSNAPTTLAESITLSANIGSVSITSGTGAGSWAWHYTAGDEGALQTVTILASENGSTLTGTQTFELSVTEVAPLVSVTLMPGTVTVGEGAAASNAGSFADYSGAPTTLAESITLSANIGSVSITSGTGAGSWAWHYTAGDEGGPDQTVTIHASENGSTLTGATSFVLHIIEVAPYLGAPATATVTGTESTTLSNSGTYADYSGAPTTADAVTLSASVGTITGGGSGSGTWHWSYSGASVDEVVTIFAFEDGFTSSVTFTLSASASSGRRPR